MRALLVAHDHVSPSGPIGEQFERRGYTLDEHLVVSAERFHTPGVQPRFPEFAGYDAVVLLGAPWSVYDDVTIGSWVGAELEQVRSADAAGVPVLGICFGGQLLAQAHGGSVAKAPAHEIGWVQVASVDERIVACGPWFEWHFDRWQAPVGAAQLAKSSDAPQAFVLRRNLAVQFHPEITPESLLGWLENGGYANARASGVDPDELIRDTATLTAANRVRAHRLVDAFLDEVA
jgi:GMP synthase-like glutamine amidotransferase